MAVGQNLTVDLLSRVINYQTYPTRNILTAASNGWLQMNPLSTATWTSTIGSMTVVYRSAYI
jgi:hypothetical protein